MTVGPSQSPGTSSERASSACDPAPSEASSPTTTSATQHSPAPAPYLQAAAGNDLLDRVPSTLGIVFSYSEALASGMSSWLLYALRDNGQLEQLGRGIYRRRAVGDAADPDLLEIRHRAPLATLCLQSALARHRLIDAPPGRVHIAIPRGVRRPPSPDKACWHSFAANTFDIGRQQLPLAEGLSIGIYSPERCIVDAFRMPNQIQPRMATEAMRRWLSYDGSEPHTLLALAQVFPLARLALRAALDSRAQPAGNDRSAT